MIMMMSERQQAATSAMLSLYVCVFSPRRLSLPHEALVHSFIAQGVECGMG